MLDVNGFRWPGRCGDIFNQVHERARPTEVHVCALATLPQDFMQIVVQPVWFHCVMKRDLAVEFRPRQQIVKSGVLYGTGEVLQFERCTSTLQFARHRDEWRHADAPGHQQMMCRPRLKRKVIAWRADRKNVANSDALMQGLRSAARICHTFDRDPVFIRLVRTVTERILAHQSFLDLDADVRARREAWQCAVQALQFERFDIHGLDGNLAHAHRQHFRLDRFAESSPQVTAEAEIGHPRHR